MSLILNYGFAGSLISHKTELYVRIIPEIGIVFSSPIRWELSSFHLFLDDKMKRRYANIISIFKIISCLLHNFKCNMIASLQKRLKFSDSIVDMIMSSLQTRKRYMTSDEFIDRSSVDRSVYVVYYSPICTLRRL